MKPRSYVCKCCGKKHPGLPTDWGFQLPDTVYSLSILQRYARSRHTTDLCTLDESQYFIRGLLPLSLPESGQTFNWGVWVRLDRKIHDRYIENWNVDISSSPRDQGVIANNISIYGRTRHLRVEIQYSPDNTRPTFWFPGGARHALALEQRHGISAKRHHDILEGLAFFSKNDA
jgi:hypothetical protein